MESIKCTSTVTDAYFICRVCFLQQVEEKDLARLRGDSFRLSKKKSVSVVASGEEETNHANDNDVVPTKSSSSSEETV